MSISDNFAGGVLDSAWSIEGPAKVSADMWVDATDTFLTLVAPDGTNDV